MATEAFLWYLYSMGRDAEPSYSSFVFPVTTKAILHSKFDMKIAVENFDELPNRKSSFHKTDGDTIEAFLWDMYELAQHCAFGKQ